MANSQAVSLAEVVPLSKGSVRRSRVIPLALLVPVVVAFGTPAFAFALLAAVLAAPILLAVLAGAAARAERGT